MTTHHTDHGLREKQLRCLTLVWWIVGIVDWLYRPCMKIREHSFSTIVLFLVLVLAGCAAEPFIYDSDRFNRSVEGFGQTPIDIDEVIVCYGESSTSPSVIVSMAKDACGAYGKVPVFVEQTYMKCPVLTPVAAVYDCEKPPIGSGSDLNSLF